MSRHLSYSIINILGLAVGFATTLLIGIWVYQEMNYDRHFEDSERIYRVGVNFMNIGDMAVGPVQLTEYARNFPEVEQTARLSGPAEVHFTHRDSRYSETNVYYADSTFFDLFSYSFLQGNSENALDQPGSVVMTRSVANKFFNGQSAIGKILLVGEEREPYTVTGVVEDPAYKSHIEADIWLRREYQENSNWLSASVYNYIKLKKDFSNADLDKRLYELIEKAVYPSLSPAVSFDEWIEDESSYRFLPLPITDIYLKSNLKFEMLATGNEKNVYIFGSIAVLVLLIASINFVNITTARSSIRAREVGVRKTLGTGRTTLVLQFIFESVVLSAIAFLVSLGLAELFLALFHSFTGLQLVDQLFADPMQLLIVFAIALVVGAAAGFYPALYLTSFKPVSVLKGDIYSPTGEKGMLRNGLVLVQFIISICLIIGTVVIYNQLQYMRTTDLGFQKENVLVIRNADQLNERRETFKQRLLGHSVVESASYNLRIPAGTSEWVTSFKTPQMEQGYPMHSFHGDYDMIETLGFRILEGRGFSRNFASDTAAVILNKRAVQILELEEPLGVTLNNNLKVIGIVADFNFESLKEEIEPVALTLRNDGDRLAIKFRDNPDEALAITEKVWEELGIASAPDYYFLDENFEAMFKKENLLARAVLLFAILAIFVSCLGLYGLSAYVTERRTKEIGIRRVLGASISQIVFMLNFKFTRIVLIAILMAIPIAYILMNRWLQDFSYKTEPGIVIFLVSGAVALLIAWATVSIQSVKTAMMNPVQSLRSE